MDGIGIDCVTPNRKEINKIDHASVIIKAKEKRITWFYKCQNTNTTRNDTTFITMNCRTLTNNYVPSFKVPKTASFQCISKNNTDFKSPDRNQLDFTSYANVWAVPCDGIVECENGEDEHESVCNVHEEFTLFSLMGGFTLILIAMLSLLLYKMKRYIT